MGNTTRKEVWRWTELEAQSEYDMRSRDITGVTGVPELTWCYNRNSTPCNLFVWFLVYFLLPKENEM